MSTWDSVSRRCEVPDGFMPAEWRVVVSRALSVRRTLYVTQNQANGLLDVSTARSQRRRIPCDHFCKLFFIVSKPVGW